MVYVKIPEEFRNGAWELLVLFFPENEFTFTDCSSQASFCDLLVSFDITGQNNGLLIKIELKHENNILYSEITLLENENRIDKARTPASI